MWELYPLSRQFIHELLRSVLAIAFDNYPTPTPKLMHIPIELRGYPIKTGALLLHNMGKDGIRRFVNPDESHSRILTRLISEKAVIEMEVTR